MPKKRIRQPVQVGFDENRTPIIKWASGYTMQEVMEQAAKLLVEYGYLQKSEHKKDSPVFSECLRQFFDTYKRRQKPLTIQTREQTIKKHILPRLGNQPIAEITTADIQKWFDDLCDAGYSRETILKIKNIISPVFRSALHDGFIRRNPLDDDRLAINTNKGTHHKAIPEEIMRTMKTRLSELDYREQMITALLCYTGQRIGEVLGMRWEDVDFDKGLIRIERGIVHPTRNQPEVGTPKTEAGIREIPLIDKLAEILNSYRSTGYIVSGEKPLSYQQLKRSMDKIRKHFEIEAYSAHDFRDTCATEWLEAGVPLYTISKILGHADMKVTEKRYVKYRYQSLIAARKIMNQASI